MISIFVLLPMYFIAIQHERGGKWKPLVAVGVVALAIDVILNYTELALMTLDFPRKGEYTFSTRLQRLQYNTCWRGGFARYLAPVLDKIAPSGRHILC